jgi:glycosyltransferase involved in cell wall biosynthesis
LAPGESPAAPHGTMPNSPASENTIISLTSVPPRFETCLTDTLNSIGNQNTGCRIVLNIPAVYRKWGAAAVPPAIAAIPGIIIHRPQKDYGPATKLLGALEYARGDDSVEYVITVDDDIRLHRRHYLRYLMAYSKILPDCVVTMRAIKLTRFPFRHDDGLKYNYDLRFVDIPQGYGGVIYPVARLRDNPLVFELAQRLPAAMFGDDDTYLGILMNMLDIAVFKTPRMPKLKKLVGLDPNSVIQQWEGDRIDEQMKLFQYAVNNGFLMNRGGRPIRELGLRERARMLATYLQFWFLP